jgi:hypothetical protein
VGVVEQDAHGLGDLVVGDGDHVVGFAQQDVQRLLVGDAAGHAVGQLRADRRRDDVAGAERVEVRGGVRGHHADQRAAGAV